MQIKSNETENTYLIKLGGEMILGHEADDFQQAIKNGIEKNKNKIVVDLSDVKFITSWGIGILIHGYTTTTNTGRSFCLAAVLGKVKETLIKIKLDKIFQQFDSVKEALNN